MLSDKELIKQFVKQRNITEYSLSSQYDFARRAHRFNSGDKGVYTAEITDQTGDKRIIVFNKIKPYVDSISGFMRQLRRNSEYSARMPDDVERNLYSELLNQASQQIRENSNMDFYESAQDKEMLIAGYGAIDTNILYEQNPDGEVREELIAYNDVGWDPQARAPNVLDARWIFRRRKLEVKEALKRFKGSTEEDFPGVSDPDKQKVFNPNDGQYTAISVQGGEDESLVEVHYYQWWELQTYYRATNPIKELDPELAAHLVELLNIIKEKRSAAEDEYVRDDLFTFDPTADTLTMAPKIKGDVIEAFKQYGITLEVQEYLKKCYYTAVLTPDKVFDKFKSPNQEGFTIKIKTADFDPELEIWYGIVRQLQEPSRYANKALTEILYTIAFNSKGGVIYEEGLTDDPQRFEREYASTKAAIRVKAGSLSSGMLMPKAQAALPTGYEGVYQMANSSMGEVTGVNKEFLGSSENKQVSALLESQRINQVVSVLAGYFDSISLFQLEQARLMLTYIRIIAENRPRPIEMPNEDGSTRTEMLHPGVMVDEYEIKISEAPTSAAQMQETGMQLVTLAAQVALLGKDIYPIVVDYIPGLKFGDKKKLQQMLNPPTSPEQVQQQKEVAALAREAQQAKIFKDKAEGAYKIVSADRERAETSHILSEAQQVDMENQLMKKVTVDNINVSI